MMLPPTNLQCDWFMLRMMILYDTVIIDTSKDDVDFVYCQVYYFKYCLFQAPCSFRQQVVDGNGWRLFLRIIFVYCYRWLVVFGNCVDCC